MYICQENPLKNSGKRTRSLKYSSNTQCIIKIIICILNFSNFEGLFIYKQKTKQQRHPAGDVTRVSVVSRKVTVKIGDAENWWRGCRDKNRFKKANIPVRLVLSRVPFKSGV